MREVKFKVWFPNMKRFLNEHDSISDCIIDLRNGKRIFNIDDYLNEETKDIEYFNDDGYILLPYIGLKDKNGKEIYLNYLLRDDENRVFQVVEDNRIAQTGYRLKLISSWNNNDHIKINQCVDFYSWMVSENENYLEVIGNIYENKELLNN